MSDECSHLWEDGEVDATPEREGVEFVLEQRCWKADCEAERLLYIVGGRDA